MDSPLSGQSYGNIDGDNPTPCSSNYAQSPGQNHPTASPAIKNMSRCYNKCINQFKLTNEVHNFKNT